MCFQGDRLAPALRPSTSPASASWREGDDQDDPDPDEQHDQNDDVSVQEYNSPPSPGTLADITMQELGQHQPRHLYLHHQPIHLHDPHRLHYPFDHHGQQT